MEHLITIPLSEYNEIKDIKYKFQKAFDEKKTIFYCRTYYSGPSGYPKNEFQIVNESELLDDLGKKLDDAYSEINMLKNELYKLQDILKEKKSWFKW